MKQFLKNRINSVKYALVGLIQFFRSEVHAKVHLLFSVLAITLSFVFQITVIEWMFIVIAIGIVFVAEMINTSIEKLVDLISPEFNEKARFIKDVAAGAVLVAAIISVVIGCLVFYKYIL